MKETRVPSIEKLSHTPEPIKEHLYRSLEAWPERVSFYQPEKEDEDRSRHDDYRYQDEQELNPVRHNCIHLTLRITGWQ